MRRLGTQSRRSFALNRPPRALTHGGLPTWSSWADDGRLPSSPIPAALSQVNLPVVILPTTAKMQCPLSMGLWVTHHSGFRGAGETRGQAPSGSGGQRWGKKPEVACPPRAVGGWDYWGCINPTGFGGQGHGQEPSSLAGAGTERPCRNPGRLSGRTNPPETLISQSSGPSGTAVSVKATTGSLLSFLASFPSAATVNSL